MSISRFLIELVKSTELCSAFKQVASLHQRFLSTCCHRRISSEDSGDVPSYAEDSDDCYSLELDMDSSQSGKMNLLEEILDSLNTTTMEQGKLSAAKSLDFFRSMEDLDYAPV